MLLRDLGEHHLKDLIQPERIFQLVTTDLPSDFPPLRTGAARTVDIQAQSADQQLAEESSDPTDFMWRQAKLPDMPGIDYDVVLQKDRQLNRRRRSRKKNENSGFF
jgi:hypothetical protein